MHIASWQIPKEESPGFILSSAFSDSVFPITIEKTIRSTKK